MADLDDNGILRFAPGDSVILMCEAVEQVDPETVRVRVFTPEGSEEIEVVAHTAIYAGRLEPPKPMMFKRLEGHDK